MKPTSYVQFVQYPDHDGISLAPTGSTNNLDGYSVSATFTTAPFFLGDVRGYCLVVSCPASGSPAGTFKVQGCCDLPRGGMDVNAPDASLRNWFDVASMTGTIANATCVALTDPAAFYRYGRVIVTMSSGTAVLTVKYSWKG